MTVDMLAFFSEEMTSAELYRYDVSGSYNSEGIWVPGTETNETIEIVIPQPLDSDSLEMAPEGEDISDFVFTFVHESVGMKTRDETEDPDQIEVQGQRYEVHSVAHWEDYGCFNEYVLKRIQ